MTEKDFWTLQGEAVALMDRIETFRPEGIRILLEALGRERDIDAVLKWGTAKYFTRMVNSIYGQRRLTAFLAKVRKYDEERSGMYKCFECNYTTDFTNSRWADCPNCGSHRLTQVGKFYDLLNIGKDKWLWIAWECWNERWIFEPENIIELDEGVETTKEAALEKINDLLGEVRWFGKNLRAKTRRKEMSRDWWEGRVNHEATGAKAIEYLYKREYWSDTFEEVPIIKRTKKRVYVRADKWDEHATVLDRQELETKGKARGGGRWKSSYYTQEGKARQEAEEAERNSTELLPECYRVLGVTPTTPLREIKRAYREKARAAHPDTGGNQADFIKVQEAYERIEGLLRHRSS